ncbi:MAG: metallophosphoesterase [Roseibium sp.]|uniref:metallophosphoesterase family protein n=1 Tax=Roseibium sp. TaxID=1936156 RepID=UPI003D9C048D
MRLLASADIHLGSPIRSAAMRNPELGDQLKLASRDAFINIVDLAISENVDALVLAGDIFDNDQPDLKSRAFLISQLTRAADARIPTVLIRGNHDALLEHRAHGNLGPNIHLLNKDTPSVEIAGGWFHGLSFHKAHVSQSLLPGYPPFLLVGLLRWRVVDNWALVAGSDAAADMMLEAVNYALPRLKRQAESRPNLLRLYKALSDVREELKGAGRNPDLLLEFASL